MYLCLFTLMNRMFSPFNTVSIVPTQQLDPRNVSELFDKIEQELLGVSERYAELGALLAFFRAVAVIHQTHHWAASGEVFFSDHLMFERAYTPMIEQIDSLAERAVGLGGTNLVIPQLQTRLIATVCEWIYAVYGCATEVQTDDQLVQLSLKAEECLIGTIHYVADKLEQCGQLTKGLDNMLAQLADDHEGTLYLFRRQVA